MYGCLMLNHVMRMPSDLRCDASRVAFFGIFFTKILRLLANNFDVQFGGIKSFENDVSGLIIRFIIFCYSRFLLSFRKCDMRPIHQSVYQNTAEHPECDDSRVAFFGFLFFFVRDCTINFDVNFWGIESTFRV